MCRVSQRVAFRLGRSRRRVSLGACYSRRACSLMRLST